VNVHQKLLLVIHAAYGLATAMAGLFLNLYFWRISQDMTVNATFMLGTFIVGPFAFWLSGLIAKKKDRLISFQLGVGFTALYYLFIILLQETVASIPFVIGVMNGLSTGFYWLGFLVLLYDIVEIEERSAFLGKQMAVLGLVATIGPALAGWIISMFNSLYGYTFIFTFSFILFIIGVILSFRLPKDTSRKSDLRIPLLLRFNRRYVSLKNMWGGWVIWGGCEGLIFFLPPLLLYEALNKEFLVGMFTIGLGITSILSSIWHARYNTKQRQPYTVLCVWLLYVAVCIPLIVNQSFWSIIIFLLVNEMSKALIGVSFFSYMLRIVGILPRRAGLRTEMMVAREATVNIGRILSILSFIWLYRMSQEYIFYLLFGVILVQGFLYLLMIYGKDEVMAAENSKQHVRIGGNV
jgi:YQGE family putative transporter